MTSSPDTEELVVLADADGQPVGTASKSAVHTEDTPLHFAFSCYLVDEGGRVLLTRRALGKKTWPGVWTNSFCGHPGPGEDTADAVRRRSAEELGLEGIEDIEVVLPTYRYRAVDASGIVENEICPVFIARAAGGLSPNPEEVVDSFWVLPEDLFRAVDAMPLAFSPWLVGELAYSQLRDALRALTR